MASKAGVSTALVVSLNLLFFALVSSRNVNYQPAESNGSSNGAGENSHDHHSSNQIRSNSNGSSNVGGFARGRANSDDSSNGVGENSHDHHSSNQIQSNSNGSSNDGSFVSGRTNSDDSSNIVGENSHDHHSSNQIQSNSNGSSNDGSFASERPNSDDSSPGVGEILRDVLNGDSSNGKGLSNFNDLSNGSGDNSNDNSKDSTTNSGKPVDILPAAAMILGALNQQGKSTCNPLKLGVCANLLNGLVKVELGDVPTQPCCTLIEGLADLEAAVCLCTAIKAKVLGIDLNLPISLSVLLNNCGRPVSSDFQCTP